MIVVTVKVGGELSPSPSLGVEMVAGESKSVFTEIEVAADLEAVTVASVVGALVDEAAVGDEAAVEEAGGDGGLTA